MQRSDIISGFIFIIFGLITIFVIIPNQISSTSAYGIGPDVFPLTLIWMFTIFCAILCAHRLLSKKPIKDADVKVDIQWHFIGLATVYLISCYLLVTYLGFVYGAIYTVAVPMLVMGEFRHKLRLVLTAILAPVLISLTFRYIFIILLP